MAHLVGLDGFCKRPCGVAGAVTAWALAVLPALPILGLFCATFQLLVDQSDEFIRHLLVRQVLFATGFCLCIMNVREILLNRDVVAAGTGGFGTAFIWLVGLGIGAIANALTTRPKAQDE